MKKKRRKARCKHPQILGLTIFWTCETHPAVQEWGKFVLLSVRPALLGRSLKSLWIAADSDGVLGVSWLYPGTVNTPRPAVFKIDPLEFIPSA